MCEYEWTPFLNFPLKIFFLPAPLSVCYLNGELVGIFALKVQLSVDPQYAGALPYAEVRCLVTRHNCVPEG
jgi:hypothetical protein